LFYEKEKQKEILTKKLLNKEFFALNRFGEGEVRVIMSGGTGVYLRCIAKSSIREWEYNPKEDKYLYEQLCESFYYKEENYIKASVGGGKKNQEEFVKKSLPNEELFTTTYFYGDDYYSDFFETYLPLMQKYESINFVCYKIANYKNVNINFKNVYNNFEISNAWKQKEETKKVIEEISKTKNSVYIFSVGFNSKIMIKKLFQENKSNVYYDFGANLDIKLYGRKTRGKHML